MTIGDPTYVTPAQLRAAYDALGLDGELFTTTRDISLAPDKVVATRWLLNDDGSTFISDSGHPMSWSVGLPVGDTDPVTALQHAPLCGCCDSKKRPHPSRDSGPVCTWCANSATDPIHDRQLGRAIGAEAKAEAS